MSHSPQLLLDMLLSTHTYTCILQQTLASHSNISNFINFYRQDGREAPTCPYCFYSWADFSVAPKNVVLINVKFGRNFTLIGSGVWVYGPKTLKILPILLPLRSGSLALFLQNLQGLCASSTYIILSNLAALAR